LRTIALTSVVAAALLAAACGGNGSSSGVAGAHTTLCAAGSQRPLGTKDSAVAALLLEPATAFREAGRSPVARFRLKNVNGAPTVFGVLGERVDARCRATWLHVQLPMRPNGATGWVRAASVQTVRLHTRIVVDLSERRVRFYEHGRLEISSSAAIGSPATPTPLGRYYVNQRLVPSDKSGPFGPAAVGVSAFSPVLTGWAQGGPIAIHGTNQPWSIGHSVSNGCIRLPNDVLRRLFAAAPAGTPVIIRR
jgi:lipoprotein-anchoring transpeptidase ErfK/SrfK